jgi:uncharacterized membrane protein
MRYASIDILRTVAIAVMVIVHFGENLSGYIPPIAGLGAPLFAFLSGASYCLWMRGQQAKGRDDSEISKVSIRRGLFVFGVGFAFNILVWLPEDTFNWDVLTFIGAALILLNQVRRIPTSVTLFAAVVALLLSPVLRAMADYPAYWVNGYFDGDLTFADVLIGFLATGYFPIFPWITFSLVGFVAGTWIFRTDHDSPPSLRVPCLIGGGLIAASVVAVQLRPYVTGLPGGQVLEGWTMYPPTIEYVAGTLGMTLVLLAGLIRWVDRNPRAAGYKGLLDIAKTFSRYAFTIYLVHHFVHIWPMWIYAVATGQEATVYWQKAMPISVALPLALVFLVCCYLVLRRLGPESGYGVEAWMRWLCD